MYRLATTQVAIIYLDEVDPLSWSAQLCKLSNEKNIKTPKHVSGMLKQTSNQHARYQCK
jgi:hypothetical protein